MEGEPPKLDNETNRPPLAYPEALPLSSPLPPLLPATFPSSAKVWGFWATLGLGFATIIAMIIAQAVGVLIFVMLRAVQGQRVNASELENNGLMLSIATLLSLPVTVGLCWLFAWLKVRRRAREYLGLRRAGWRSYVSGFLGLGIIMLTWMGTSQVFDVPAIPPFVIEVYRTAEIYPLLWFAIIIAAPIMEEILFRGFFFEGFSQSRAGAMGAILIPSSFWALMHVQYGMHEIVLLFLFGLILGVLRLKSGSIIPGVVIHAVNNLISTVEVAMLIRGE
jgi:membrane protease YdiL (CAAX protease family)